MISWFPPFDGYVWRGSNYETFITLNLLEPVPLSVFYSDSVICHVHVHVLSSRKVVIQAKNRPGGMALAFFYCHHSINHHF